jgi:hypothetical protein
MHFYDFAEMVKLTFGSGGLACAKKSSLECVPALKTVLTRCWSE